MSGGRFDYVDGRLKDEIFGWTDEPRNVFEDKEISELVWDVLDLIHDFDWYASGDICEETYRKDVNFFKKKWLKLSDEKRIRQYVDDELEFAREELIKALIVESDGNG